MRWLPRAGLVLVAVWTALLSVAAISTFVAFVQLRSDCSTGTPSGTLYLCVEPDLSVWISNGTSYVLPGSSSGTATLQAVATQGRAVTDADSLADAVTIGRSTSHVAIYDDPTTGPTLGFLVGGSPVTENKTIYDNDPWEIKNQAGSTLWSMTHAGVLNGVGLTASRCLRTDGSNNIVSAAADCGAGAGSTDMSTLTGPTVTVSDGSQASQAWTYNLSGTDPVVTYSSGAVGITGNQTVSGTLNVTGVATLGGVTSTSTGTQTIGSTNNAGGAITINANGGTSETVLIRSQQGTGVTAVNIVASNGGIRLNAQSDTNVVNNATVGGTLAVTGTATLGAAELTEDDTDPTCAAGNYNLYADLSETAIKACNNGVKAKVSTATQAVSHIPYCFSALDSSSGATSYLVAQCGATTSNSPGSDLDNAQTSRYIIQVAGTITRIDCTTDAVTSGTLTLTARLNGSNQSMATTLTTATLQNNSTANSFAVAIGDVISMEMGDSSANSGTSNVRCALLQQVTTTLQ